MQLRKAYLVDPKCCCPAAPALAFPPPNPVSSLRTQVGSRQDYVRPSFSSLRTLWGELGNVERKIRTMNTINSFLKYKLFLKKMGWFTIKGVLS